jgi:hypothetical protein
VQKFKRDQRLSKGASTASPIIRSALSCTSRGTPCVLCREVPWHPPARGSPAIFFLCLCAPFLLRGWPTTPTGDLRHARGYERRWGTAEELDEPPQVLRGGGEQHLISGTAQASQPKSVKPENALHVANRISTFLRSRRDCWKASVLANARTRSRTPSLRSRVTLRATAVVHFGFSEHVAQSFLLAL